MLGLMRRLTQNKFTGGFLLALVVISMAVWGTDDIFSGNFGSSIIKAGERSVTEQQINRRFENYLNDVRREQPGNAITRQEATQQGVLDQIFTSERNRLTMLGYARNLEADASGTALLEDVNSIEAFKNPLTNKFDSQYYRNALARSEFSVNEFENDTQDRLTINYLIEGIGSALVPPTDIARIQAVFDGEVRYISWFPIEQASIPALAEPSQEQLRAFYETQKAAFEAPERRQFSMLNLSPDDFLHTAEYTEEDILSYYEATKTQRLSTPEERTFTEAAFPNEQSAQQAFGILAVGGDISNSPNATITNRTLTKDQVAIDGFREQLFAGGAPVGSVAGPFEANGTWIIGRLLEIMPGTPKTLEETREEIIAAISAEMAELAFYTAVNEFDNLIGEGYTISEIAERYGAPVLSFEPVDQRALSQDGAFLRALTVSPDAFRQAFELPQGETTDRFDQDNTAIMISIDKVIPKEIPPFEDIEDRVKLGYNISKQGEALKTAADAVKATLDTGISTMEEQAELYNSEVKSSERGLRRTAFDRALPQQVVRGAFALDTGDVSVVQGDAPTQLVILKMDRVDRPKASELDVLAPISAPKISEQLNQDILFAFDREVKDALEVDVNERAYAAFKNRLLEDQ